MAEIALGLALLVGLAFALTVSLLDRRRAKQIEHDLAEDPRVRRLRRR